VGGKRVIKTTEPGATVLEPEAVRFERKLILGFCLLAALRVLILLHCS
jgi:hypothetical protein